MNGRRNVRKRKFLNWERSRQTHDFIYMDNIADVHWIHLDTIKPVSYDVTFDVSSMVDMSNPQSLVKGTVIYEFAVRKETNQIQLNTNRIELKKVLPLEDIASLGEPTLSYDEEDMHESIKRKKGSSTIVIVIDPNGYDWEYKQISVSEAERIFNKFK